MKIVFSIFFSYQSPKFSTSQNFLRFSQYATQHHHFLPIAFQEIPKLIPNNSPSPFFWKTLDQRKLLLKFQVTKSSRCFKKKKFFPSVCNSRFYQKKKKKKIHVTTLRSGSLEPPRWGD